MSLEKVSEGEVYQARKAHNALARIDNRRRVAVVVVDARERAAVHGLNALDVHITLALLGALEGCISGPAMGSWITLRRTLPHER